MTKAEFEKRVQDAHNETHDALAEVWSDLNNGHQKKLLKNENVSAVLKRYVVIEKPPDSGQDSHSFQNEVKQRCA